LLDGRSSAAGDGGGNSSPVLQVRVGGVDDGIDLGGGDVALDETHGRARWEGMSG
jgi:hypothetical protein